jgi:hypothetical protein
MRAKHSCVGPTGQQERQHPDVTIASGVVKRSLAVLIDTVDVAADVLACGTREQMSAPIQCPTILTLLIAAVTHTHTHLGEGTGP